MYENAGEEANVRQIDLLDAEYVEGGEEEEREPFVHVNVVEGARHLEALLEYGVDGDLGGENEKGKDGEDVDDFVVEGRVVGEDLIVDRRVEVELEGFGVLVDHLGDGVVGCGWRAVLVVVGERDEVVGGVGGGAVEVAAEVGVEVQGGVELFGEAGELALEAVVGRVEAPLERGARV